MPKRRAYRETGTGLEPDPQPVTEPERAEPERAEPERLDLRDPAGAATRSQRRRAGRRRFPFEP